MTLQTRPFRRCGRCTTDCTTVCTIKTERARAAYKAAHGITEGTPVVVHRGTPQ